MVEFTIENTLKFLVVIITDFFLKDDGIDENICEHIIQIILDGNVMKMSLIIAEGIYVDIETDDYSFHGYYIIKFYSSTHTLQTDLVINGKVIFPVKWFVKELIAFQSIINFIIMFYNELNLLTYSFL